MNSTIEINKECTFTKTFYKRYIEENAKQRLGMEMLKFLLFREGRFINPMKKNEILQNYIEEEIQNFQNGQLNIPQLEFCITTKCTLKCKDCCALIPKFNSNTHIDMNFDNFKLWLDKILGAVDSIRHFVILGGEPLINTELPKMLDYACKQDKIFVVQLITNGTMNFSNELIEVLKNNNKKAGVYLSDYSGCDSIKSILKHDEIKKVLKENNIKMQITENKDWVTEKEFAPCKTGSEITSQKLQDCFRVQCNQVLNGHIDICSKSATARELGLLDIKDSIDIINSKDLKQDFINFYNNECPEACAYCILSNEKVQSAIQLSK